MLRRERKYLRANFVELGGKILLPLRIHFIDGHDERLAGSPQAPGQLQIERGGAGTSVHDQHERGGAVNRCLRLLENLTRDRGAIVGEQSSGIDDFKRSPAPSSRAINTVASDARLVGDN